MALTRESLIEYMEQEHGVDPSQIESDDTELFSSGLLDSFSMVDMLTFIEDSASIKISTGDVNLDNLDSVGKILAFVGSQTG